MTLPKFLLAWADCNWMGVFKHLRPARDARWSVSRVVLLTLLKGIGGALLGLILALLIFHQPVGWLPWMLGLFAGCAGLCWFSVTAICWNQRAAQLKSNPALPVGLSKTRYRFFRACLGFVYFVVLGIVTPFALFITVENFRGELAWQHERAQLKAAGEKLTFGELLAPQIPATMNAGASAFFAPFFDYRIGPSRVSRNENGENIYHSGLVWMQSNRLHHLDEVFKLPSDYLPKSSQGSRQEPRTPLIRMADWSAAYQSAVANPRKDDVSWASALKLPKQGDPVQVVLAGLARSDEDLASACAAAALPRAQFPIHYDEGFQALIRHVTALKAIQQTLRLRGAAHLAAGQTAAAFSDATNAINVAELLREEPLLISQLVRYAQMHIAISTLWQGLAEHRWSDAQLAEFQRRLAQVDYLPGLELAFAGERACGVESINREIEGPRHSSFIFDGDSPSLPLIKSLSRGVLRENETTLVHYESVLLAGLRRAITNSAQMGLVGIIDAKDIRRENVVPHRRSPYTLLVHMLGADADKAAQKTVRTQTLVKLTIIACALERYRLAHGEFPQQLGQLTPQFVADVPLDPMINQPFHYQPTDDGWFLLYSVGLNGKDDGGVMKSDERSDQEEKDWPWPVPTRPTHPRLF